MQAYMPYADRNYYNAIRRQYRNARVRYRRTHVHDYQEGALLADLLFVITKQDTRIWDAAARGTRRRLIAHYRRQYRIVSMY